MFMRDAEVVRTALVAAAMTQACAVGYELALRTLLIQQFATMTEDELAIIAVEIGVSD
jgi:hypothetical protein